MDECQALIGYAFLRRELLKAALTHTSGANTRGASNERMEFLGDSVLGLVVCEALFLRYADYQEGDLTKIKSVIVSRKTCAKITKSIGLERFLILGKAFAGVVEPPANILADVFEALIGAVFLDGGYDAAKDWILRWIGPEIDEAAKEAMGNNAKSQLQTYAQKEFCDTPRYPVLDEQGPDHDKCFKVAAEIGGHTYTAVWGRNKKEAELRAAQNAIAEMTGQPLPYPAT